MKIYQWILCFSLFVPTAFAQHQASVLHHHRPDDGSLTALQEASAYYYERNYPLALDLLNRLISREASYADAFQLRAKTKIAMDDKAAAFSDYSAAVHLAPEKKDFLFERAILAYQMKRWEVASADFHKVLHNTDTETTTVYFKGNSDAHGFSTSGVTTLQSDMKADIYNYLGMVHMETGELDSSSYYLKMALQRNPYEADIHVNLGLLQLHKGDTLQALSAFKQALTYQTDHQEALINLNSLTSTSQKDLLMAEILDKAITEMGTYQAYYNRGIMLQQKGEHRKAIQDFDQAISLAGNQPDLLLMRAYSREFSADWQGAINDYLLVTHLDPTRVQAFTNLGNVYYKLKRYKKAAEIYEAAIKITPKDGKILYNAGLAYYLSGNKLLSCQYLQRALELGFTGSKPALQKYCK